MLRELCPRPFGDMYSLGTCDMSCGQSLRGNQSERQTGGRESCELQVSDWTLGRNAGETNQPGAPAGRSRMPDSASSRSSCHAAVLAAAGRSRLTGPDRRVRMLKTP